MSHFTIAIVLQTSIDVNTLSRLKSSSRESVIALLESRFPFDKYDWSVKESDVVFSVKSSLLSPKRICDLKKDFMRICLYPTQTEMDHYERESLKYKEMDMEAFLSAIKDSKTEEFKWITVQDYLHLPIDGFWRSIRVERQGIEIYAPRETFVCEIGGEMHLLSIPLRKTMEPPLGEYLNALIIDDFD